MSRLATAATSIAIALALFASSAQAKMPTGTPLTPQQRSLARKQIVKDAKAFLKSQNFKLNRPSYRVTFGTGGFCGTPPITVTARATINSVQTSWPNFNKVRRPAFGASFDATAFGKNVSTQRNGDWNAVLYLQAR